MSDYRRQLLSCFGQTRILRLGPPKWLTLLWSLIFCGVFALPAMATTAPTITPGTGVYSTVRPTATITGDPGAVIHFTTNGTSPSALSPIYTAAIPLSDKNVIKAMASLSGVDSAITTAYILNDPSSLPVPRSGLQLWLQGDLGPIVSGTNVTQWSDLSGATNNATQGTMANQPTLLTNALHGSSAVNFNGTSSYLTLTSGLNDLSAGTSLYAVISPNTPTGAKTLYTSGAAGVTDMVSVQTNGTTATANFNNGATASNIASAAAALATLKYQELGVVHNGAASATMDVNAAPVKTGAVQNLNTVSRTVNRIGTSSALSGYWGGKLAELLVYSRALSASEHANVTAYLASKYQLNFNATTPAPTIAPATSTLLEPGQVAISANPSAEVRVTRDGTNPTISSPLYTGPFTAFHTQTIKAIAVYATGTSAISTSTLTLNSTKYPAPNASDARELKINLQLPTTGIAP